MKKATAIVLALLMVLSLAACGSASSESKTLVMATSADYPPFENLENGEAVGFDVDLCKAVADELGLKFEVVNNQFDTLLTGLAAGGKFDVVLAGMTVEPERAELADFTDTYYVDDQAVAVMKDGVIQHVGTPRDIYQRPKNVFVATFIGRTNIVNAHVKDGIITFADGYHEHIDALDKAAEQDVRCSIRPEEFIICKDGTDGIHGTVQECTYLGLNTHYTIDTDQGDSVEIVEESSIGEGLKKGEKVLLKVKKEKINVFTKDGGTNLIRSDAYEKQ